jgi:hypothetical protein
MDHLGLEECLPRPHLIAGGWSWLSTGTSLGAASQSLGSSGLPQSLALRFQEQPNIPRDRKQNLLVLPGLDSEMGAMLLPDYSLGLVGHKFKRKGLRTPTSQ